MTSFGGERGRTRAAHDALLSRPVDRIDIPAVGRVREGLAFVAFGEPAWQ